MFLQSQGEPNKENENKKLFGLIRFVVVRRSFDEHWIKTKKLVVIKHILNLNG